MDESRKIRARRQADMAKTELVGGVEKRDLFLADDNAAWVSEYAVHEAHIRHAVGKFAVAVEHIGSTSIPGLAAKPIIDILVMVRDITAEEDYLDPLIDSGYVLRVREPRPPNGPDRAARRTHPHTRCR